MQFIGMLLGPAALGYLLNFALEVSALVRGRWGTIALFMSLVTIFTLWYLGRAFGRSVQGGWRGLIAAVLAPGIPAALYFWQFHLVSPGSRIPLFALIPQLYFTPLVWPVARFLGDMGLGGDRLVGTVSLALMVTLVVSGYLRGAAEAFRQARGSNGR